MPRRFQYCNPGAFYYSDFLPLTRDMIASTAQIRHHVDHMYKSLYPPAMVYPQSAPIIKSTISAIFPPLLPLRVAIDTIPPAKSIIATITPADPPTSPFASSVLATPAAQDWNVTNTKSTIDKIPDTSFQVFISSPHFPPFLKHHNI